MNLTYNTFVRLLSWIAERLQLTFSLSRSELGELLNERELLEQLHYGRD